MTQVMLLQFQLHCIVNVSCSTIADNELLSTVPSSPSDFKFVGYHIATNYNDFMGICT